MLKQFRFFTLPTPARQDALFPKQGRRRVETGGVIVSTLPSPSCQDSSFLVWGTLRISMSRERRMGKDASRRVWVGRVRRVTVSAFCLSRG